MEEKKRRVNYKECRRERERDRKRKEELAKESRVRERTREKSIKMREPSHIEKTLWLSFSLVATKTNFLHVGILKSNLRVETRRG
jgi:hypothetical protein